MWYRRPSKPAPQPPPIYPAGLAIMAEDWVANKRPDVVGELITGKPADDPPEWPPPFHPPPPDWAEEERLARERELEQARREHQEQGLDEETPAAHPPPVREPS
jgi:hypothetical protein